MCYHLRLVWCQIVTAHPSLAAEPRILIVVGPSKHPIDSLPP
jgi:hypothetical protein